MLEVEGRRKAHRVRSWYGLNGEIEIESGLWHLVRVGRIPLGHPPVVNLILRRGLPHEDRLRLSYLHEFGHFQTLPLALAYVLLLLWAGRGRRRSLHGWLLWVIGLAVAHEAIWEIVSEAYVMGHDRSGYRETYRKISDLRLPTFWAVMGGLGAGLSWWLMR